MKKPWLSRTLWANTIAMAAIVVQSQTGYVVPPEAQAAAIALANTVLRIVTRQPLDWSAPGQQEGL